MFTGRIAAPSHSSFRSRCDVCLEISSNYISLYTRRASLVCFRTSSISPLAIEEYCKGTHISMGVLEEQEMDGRSVVGTFSLSGLLSD